MRARSPTLWVAAAVLCASQTAFSQVKPVHHYVFFGQDREALAGAEAFFQTKALEGAQITYSWRQLEPDQDRYDFQMIEEDLALLTARGKRLFVQLQDVTFSDSRINVPLYLQRDSTYHGGVAQQHPGWVARRWDPAVQQRFYKLLDALGKALDGRIEGINLPETALDFETGARPLPPGFSFEGYRDAVIQNMKALKRAFPKAVAMQYANFMPGEWRPTEDKGYLRAVYRAATEAGIALGGPDLLPHRRGQLGNSYPLLREASGAVPTGIAVQDDNFKGVTCPELLDFATAYLRVDYIFWGTQEPYYSEQVIPCLQRIK